jgi:hypothetical protein
MMPTQLMSRAVSMPADALSQLLHFFNELLARHPFKISVHVLLLRVSRPIIGS